VPILLDRLVRAGRIDLPTLVTRLSAGPARVMNLPGGSLAAGAPADITALDLEPASTARPPTLPRSRASARRAGGARSLSPPAAATRRSWPAPASARRS